MNVEKYLLNEMLDISVEHLVLRNSQFDSMIGGAVETWPNYSDVFLSIIIYLNDSTTSCIEQQIKRFMITS